MKENDNDDPKVVFSFAGEDGLEVPISKMIEDESFRELLRAAFGNAIPIMAEIAERRQYLHAALQSPIFGGRSYGAIIAESIGNDGKLIEGNLLEKLLEECRKRSIKISPNRVEKVPYPVDPMNAGVFTLKFWNALAKSDPHGQIGFNLANATDRKKGRDIPAAFSINFDALADNVHISKHLTSFDKRVYVGVAAAFSAGNEIITVEMIHAAMGGTSSPSQNQIDRINNSLMKMQAAFISYDNKAEAAAYKNMPYVEYTGYLLPFERITVSSRGKITNMAIKLLKEPPLMTFARERRQITTFDIKLLQSPLSMTDTNLAIEDYLLERIARAKHAQQKSCRILISTMFERAEIKEVNQRKRAPKKIQKYLDYYASCDFIKGYKIGPERIDISL